MTAEEQIQAEIARLEKRMEHYWFDLAMAEQRGQPAHALERMYARYLKSLDEFIACQRAASERRQIAS